MKKTLTAKQVQDAYTQVVNNYLAGRRFNVSTMAGHQGEIAKVDVADDQYIYRIVMFEDTTDWEKPDTIVIEVRRFKAIRNAGINDRDTLWTDRGELVEEHKFYRLRSGVDVFTDDLEAAEEARKKRVERFNTTHSTHYLNLDLKRVCKKIVNNHKGYKTVRPTDIKGVSKQINTYSKTTYYKIDFNDCRKDAILIRAIVKA